MDFLIDASLPRGTAEVLRQHGHGATDVRDIGLGSAADPLIGAHAREGRLCLLTGDNDFGNIRDYPPEIHFGIVVVQAHSVGTKSDVLASIQSFLMQAEIIDHLAGRLAVIDEQRIRLRPSLDSR